MDRRINEKEEIQKKRVTKSRQESLKQKEYW